MCKKGHAMYGCAVDIVVTSEKECSESDLCVKDGVSSGEIGGSRLGALRPSCGRNKKVKWVQKWA